MLPVLDKSASVQILAASGQNYVPSPAYPSGFKCNIQPESSEMVVMADGQFFKSYAVYAPLTASGVYENNRLLIDGYIYTVMGRQVFNTPTGLQHVRFTVERALP